MLGVAVEVTCDELGKLLMHPDHFLDQSGFTVVHKVTRRYHIVARGSFLQVARRSRVSVRV